MNLQSTGRMETLRAVRMIECEVACHPHEPVGKFRVSRTLHYFKKVIKKAAKSCDFAAFLVETKRFELSTVMCK